MAVYTLNPTVTVQDIDRIKKAFGLDQPIYVQYLKWAGGMATFDWGNSFFGGRSVRDTVLERVPATFLLMGTSLALACICGVPIGVLSAVKRYSFFDYLATTGALVAMSFPTFWFGLMAIFLFAVKLRLQPAGGMDTTGTEFSLIDRLLHLILPVTVLALVLIAQWSRYARNSVQM
jgi:peptide/nickel transport system permease protein